MSLVGPSIHGQTFTKVTTASFETMTNAKSEWVDFDSDGLLDLFVAGTNGSDTYKMVVYYNNGDNTFNSLTLVNWTNVGYDFGDYNNDGFIDIILNGNDASSTPHMSVFENVSGSSFTEKSFGLTAISRGGVAWVDIDSDTDLDIVASGLNSSNDPIALLYEYDGGSYTLHSQSMTGLSSGDLITLDANGDGLTEVVITGFDDAGDLGTIIYTLNRDFTVQNYQTTLEAYGLNRLAQGDFNEDGTPDIAITGYTDASSESSDLLKNNGSNSFTIVSSFLDDLDNSSVDFGDLDNDGLLDIILMGTDGSNDKHFYYYKNGASYSFTSSTIAVEPIYNGDAALGDFDNDGDLDLFQVGNSLITTQANLYTSDVSGTTINVAPSVPTGLTITSQEDSVTLSWGASTDALTAASSLTYAIYLSTTSSAGDLLVAPLSDITTGYRKSDKSGNAGYNLTKTLYNLPEGTYYWSVQAIDNGHKGSAFASEESFGVCYKVDLGNDTTICRNEEVTFEITDPAATVVNWYTKNDGLKTSNSRTYVHLAAEKDTVIAEITKSYGCTVYDTLVVDVYDLPDFDLGDDTSICFGENITLSVSDLGIIGLDSVNWYSPGEGLLLNDNENLVFEVLKMDTLIAEVFNVNGCVNYDSLIVDVYDLPGFNLGKDTSICYAESVTFSVSGLGIVGLDSVNWYSLVRDSVLIANSEDVTYFSFEKDTLVAEVFNVNGCVNYDSLVVDVYDLPTFDLGNDTTICYAENLPLTVSGLGIIGLDSVNWYSLVRDSALIKDSESVVYQAFEKDTLVAEVFNVNGCVNYDSLIVEVFALPSFNVGNDTTICYGEQLPLSIADLNIIGLDSVNWYSLVRDSSLVTNAESVIYEVLEKDTLVVEVFNASGCVNYDSLIVDVYDLPSFNVGNDTTICYAESVSFSVSGLGIVGLDSVNWYSLVRDSALIANSENVTYFTFEKDTLVAEVFNVNGCVNYDSVIVDVYALPDFNVGNDTTICYAESLTLSVSGLGIVGLDSVNWYSLVRDSSLIANSEDVTYFTFEKDTLVAEVFNVNGCVNYDSIIVDVYALPAFYLGNDTTICYAESLTLSVTDLGIVGLDSVNWYSTGQGTLVQGNDSLVYEVFEKDTLVAEVFNVNGCVNYDSLIVDVFALPSFNIGNDTTICYGESVYFSVSGLGIAGLDSVNWYSLVRDSALIANSEDVTYFTFEKDTLVAEVFNVNGCVNYDSLVVDVYALPAYYLGPDTTICYAESLTLSVSDLGIIGLDSVNWYSTGQGSLLTDSETMTYEVFVKDTLIAEVFNVNGCVNYDSLIVDVFALPSFNIGNDTSICYSEIISLRTGAFYAEVNWYSKNTGDTLEQDSWFFNYEVFETDTIIAQVYNTNGCVNYDTIAIAMDPLPVFDLGEDPSVCYGDSLELSVDGSWEEINWFTFNDQLLEGDSPNYKFRVVEDVELWAEVWTDKGCVQYDTVLVSVLPLPEFDLPEEVVYCYADSIVLEPDVDAANYTWVNSSNSIVSSESSWHAIASASDSIWLTLESDAGCFYQDSLNLVVNALPVYDILGTSPLCIEDSTELTTSFESPTRIAWYVASDTISRDTLFYYLPEATTYVHTRLQDSNGCVTIDSMEVVVNPRPDVFAGVDTLICYGESIELGQEALSGHTYSWTNGESLSDASVANPIASPDEPTTYVLEEVNEYGCNQIDSVYIEVNPNIVIEAGPDVAICLGDSATIGGDPTASGSQFAYTYSWSPKNNILNPQSANPSVFPESTTMYYVEVQSHRCVVEYDSVLVTVNYQPEVEVSPQLSVGGDESVTLEAYGGVEYEWSPENSLDNPVAQFPEASPLETTLYTVKVTDENGCVTYETVNVLVQNVIFIPNLFTPNGDGNNDVFLVYGSGMASISFAVYDLNGTRVYYTNSVTQANEIGWDGTYNGRDLPNGTYLWSISGEYYNGSSLTFEGRSKGTIKLLR